MADVVLNEGQRRAVEHERGPVVVLAGPGTGKTRVIVHRVEHMITQRGIAPENILAVTFTVKAAGELRERLAGLVGPGAADRLNIHTYNGFGQRLLRRFADLAGLPSEVELIDDAQRRRLARELISTHGLFEDRAAEGLDALAGKFETYLELFADHAVMPDRAAAFAEKMQRRADENTQGLSGDALRAVRGRAEEFEQVARLYGLFERECRRRGWVSFGDQILLTLRLLRTNATAAAICRQDYRHLVVDEFQDANVAQIELLRVLAPPDPDEGSGPDLCVVGDDDQSIYGFRGADDLAFQRFARIWPGYTRIDLTENYRSEAAVIAAANSTIARATMRFAPEKRVERPMTMKGQPAAPGAGVECIHLEEDRYDGEVIAALLRTDRTRSTKAGAERSWSHYAVIGRSHADLDRIAAALELENIPCVRQRRASSFDETGVADVRAWIALLVQPRDTYAAQRLLMRPPFRLPAQVVADLVQRYRSMAARLRMSGEEGVDPPSVAEWLARAGAVGERAAEVLAGFASRFAALREIAASHPADEAIYRIIMLTGVAEADMLAARDRARRVTGLVSLVRFARDRQDRLEPPGDLSAFSAYFDDLDAHSRDPIAEEGAVDAGDDADAGPDVEGVRLLTAHSSKGLEFDTVFVPRISPSAGYGRTRGDDVDVTLPDGLVDRSGDDRSEKERRIAEERRLFYVACTRAERRLVLLSKKNKSPSTSTHFFEEFTRCAEGATLVTVREQADVLIEGVAAETLTHGASADRSDIEREAPDLAARATRGEILARARRTARAEAAGALDAAELHGSDLTEIEDRMREAAERLRAIAEIERTNEAPAWAMGRTAEIARALVETLARVGIDKNITASAALAAPKPPLELSYTAIHDYDRCPRCYYLKHILRLGDKENRAGQVGNIVHEVLKDFALRWRARDADGSGPADGLFASVSTGTRIQNELQRLGRETYLRKARGEPAEDELKQILGLLAGYAEHFHDPAAHVLEIEREIRVPYLLEGRTHYLTAKIDRVDQVAGPGPTAFRIIDYKTGKTKDSLVEPKEDDLQMGIYAMALSHYLQGGKPAEPEAETPRGVAEYWLLRDGQRGQIGLDRLNLLKVRKKIDKSIAGILAGDFNAKCGGSGECGLLGEA